MKITLDEREIVAIIEEWAKRVHKTKDVSSIFKVDITPEETGPRHKLIKKATLNQIYIDLEVMISDKNYGDLDSSPTHEAVLRARQAMITENVTSSLPNRLNPLIDVMAVERGMPDLTGPPLEGNTTPIA